MYYSRWPHGYLWIAELLENGTICRVVDEKGDTKFARLTIDELNHVGQDHSKCAGENVRDKGWYQ
jgi:hypothetical protein